MSQLDMLVSIIVPAYNAQLHLAECLDSLLKQTYSNLQIIVVDDGSTDNTAVICDEYRKKDERIVVIHKENEGVSAARNTGINVAVGECIQFVDADDLLVAYAIEHVVQKVKSLCADVLYFSFEAFDKEGIYRPVPEHKKFPSAVITSRKKIFQLIHEGIIGNHVWTFCFRKDFLKSHRLQFDSKIPYGEDILFVNQIATVPQKFCCLNESLYRYRKSEQTVTQCHSLKNSLSDLEVVRQLDALHMKYTDLDDEGYHILRIRMLIDAYSILPLSKKQKDAKSIKKHIVNEIRNTKKTNLLNGLSKKYLLKYVLVMLNMYDLIASLKKLLKK